MLKLKLSFLFACIYSNAIYSKTMLKLKLSFLFACIYSNAM